LRRGAAGDPRLQRLAGHEIHYREGARGLRPRREIFADGEQIPSFAIADRQQCRQRYAQRQRGFAAEW
jgi:hypothetical protein